MITFIKSKLKQSDEHWEIHHNCNEYYIRAKFDILRHEKAENRLLDMNILKMDVRTFWWKLNVNNGVDTLSTFFLLASLFKPKYMTGASWQIILQIKIDYRQ